MSDFSYGDFMTITGEIERYLGYLKGNETVAKYLQDSMAHVELSGVEAAWSGPLDWRTPATSEYVVDFNMWHWIYYIHPPGDAGRSGWADQLRAGAEQSWKNGVAWANGIGGYLRDLCADITRPDADNLKSAVQDFSEARIALEGAIPVDWTDLDFNSWNGLSSDDCQDVITEFHNVTRDQYLTYYAHAETLFAGACALTAQTQNGLNPMLREFRDGIKAQLKEWAWSGKWPEDYAGLNPLIPNIAGIVSDVVDLVPVVGDIKGKVEDVGGITGKILGLFGVEPDFSPREAFDAKDAEQIYTEMMASIQDDYLTPFDTGMQRLKSDRSGPIHNAQNGINPWMMDTLAGIENEPWEHDAEA